MLVNGKRKKIIIILLLTVMTLMIIYSNLAKQGVARGLIISTNVIIPSLFPFMVCVTLITRCKFEFKNGVLSDFLNKLFGQNVDMFFTFLLSMIGGYPVGAKMTNELYRQKAIDEKTANIMLMYCVNAGPAFVVCVVGDILGSKKLGVVLLISHLLSSIIIAAFCSFKTRKQIKNETRQKTLPPSFSNDIIDSVNDAVKSVIGICSFIVLFSVLITYFDYFSSDFPMLNYVTTSLEITSSLYKTKNIYLLSFLLGFGGVSIWWQVFSLSSDFKLNKRRFIAGRTLHGATSVIITKIILSVLKIRVSTFSNDVNFVNKYLYSNVTLIVSMSVMLILLMIFIYTKNNSGKIIDDVI